MVLMSLCRGLFLDKELGHLLKIDSFGNIIFCVHGKNSLTKEQIENFYPSMVVHNEDIARRYIYFYMS
jgi:5'-nucleotidase